MFDIILSSFAYVKGGSLNQGHSQGLEGCLGGGSERLSIVGTYIRSAGLGGEGLSGGGQIQAIR